MNWIDYLIIFATTIALCFSLVLLVGAPYVPTLPKQTKAALDEVAVMGGKPLLYELGSGDGTVMKAAALRGIRSIGYELNPIIWLISKIRLWKYRQCAEPRFGDFWPKNISDADVIFVFLHPRFMKKLDNKITQECSKNIKLISFAFEIPDKKMVKKTEGLFIYEYSPQKSEQ